ncbi:hypothetical protein ILYODFUR_027304 [Ilyodon furcidens]|uniref:Uncharacterized protein n=1 Tax=Ilyodon furcidens TaxID=33524 RepID=A0ABV0T1Q9_9TELE
MNADKKTELENSVLEDRRFFTVRKVRKVLEQSTESSNQDAYMHRHGIIIQSSVIQSSAPVFMCSKFGRNTTFPMEAALTWLLMGGAKVMSATDCANMFSIDPR